MPDVVISKANVVEASLVREILLTGVPSLYRGMVAQPLELALQDPNGEEQLLIARDRPAGAITGFVLFGIVPATAGAGRIRCVAIAPLARRRGVGRALLQAACDELASRGARFAMVELPDDAESRFLWALLEASGFREESRAVELVRPDVAMRYVRKELREERRH